MVHCAREGVLSEFSTAQYMKKQQVQFLSGFGESVRFCSALFPCLIFDDLTDSRSKCLPYA